LKHILDVTSEIKDGPAERPAKGPINCKTALDRLTPSEVKVMKIKVLALLLVPLALSLSACGDTWGQRAATGGAIGAGTGLGIAAIAGWPLIGPALVGGALGAGIGAATAPGGIK
jgi:hypothetical protein